MATELQRTSYYTARESELKGSIERKYRAGAIFEAWLAEQTPDRVEKLVSVQRFEEGWFRRRIGVLIVFVLTEEAYAKLPPKRA